MSDVSVVMVVLGYTYMIASNLKRNKCSSQSHHLACKTSIK